MVMSLFLIGDSMFRLALIFTLLLPPSLHAAELTTATITQFSGSWRLNGSYEELGVDSSLHLYRLSGIIHLRTPLVADQDLWTRCFALESRSGSAELRCLAHDDQGDSVEIFARGKSFTAAEQFKGELVSGTGSYLGIKGNFTMSWSNIHAFREERKLMVSGESMDFSGSCSLPQ